MDEAEKAGWRNEDTEEEKYWLSEQRWHAYKNKRQQQLALIILDIYCANVQNGTAVKNINLPAKN